jgi:hypothetical protein
VMRPRALVERVLAFGDGGRFVMVDPFDCESCLDPTKRQ